MGWWSEPIGNAEIILGDEPLDIAGTMVDDLVRIYLEDQRRKPTVRELERTLEIALASRIVCVFDEGNNCELAGVSIRLRKRPKRQRFGAGDYFAVPLPSGGYGFGHVRGVYTTTVVLADFLDVRAESILKLDELRSAGVLFEALCGYLGLASWRWLVVRAPGASAAKADSLGEAELARELDRLNRFVGPGTAEKLLEDRLQSMGTRRQ